MEHNFECRLPDRFPKGCKILIVDPMLATGNPFPHILQPILILGYHSFCVSPIDFTPRPMLCLNGLSYLAISIRWNSHCSS
jgi:hypothetical protein